MNTAQKVAQELIKIGAVKFTPKNPVTFKSGISSPVYVDNREFPFYPDSWKVVLEGFQNLISENNIEYEIIAGVAVAGIPHSAALAYSLGKPSIFIRKEAKDHGTKTLVEGGDIRSKKTLLVEDLVSLGTSSLSAVKEIRQAGGVVNDCLVIVSYDFADAKEAFKKANVNLHALTSVPVILEEALKLGELKQEEVDLIREWYVDPHSWDNK